MSFIDWSDPEELLSLLVEYLQDERASSHEDSERQRFLLRPIRSLRELQRQFHAVQVEQISATLRGLAAAAGEDFECDPVIEHVEACAEELDRINSMNTGQQIVTADV